MTSRSATAGCRSHRHSFAPPSSGGSGGGAPCPSSACCSRSCRRRRFHACRAAIRCRTSCAPWRQSRRCTRGGGAIRRRSRLSGCRTPSVTRWGCCTMASC
eukprot:1439025-Prymnesium_polylepis.1